MNRFYFMLLMVFVPFLMDAQIVSEINPANVVYNTEKTIDLRVHTNGYAIAYNWGNIRTYYKTLYYQVELGKLNDPRESPQNRNNAFVFNRLSSSYKFGKQNDVFVARLGKGVKRYLTDQAKRRGVSIGYNLEGGASMAIIKPYYLELIYPKIIDGRTGAELKVEKYTTENANKFLNNSDIYGRANWSNGLRELSIAPGIQGKASVFFSLGTNDKVAKSIEVGMMGDLFIKKLPLMVETPVVRNKPYFLNLYVNLQFGKRN
ncbi:MAG: hypothetical protein WAT92_10985 [Saprospiraceae bacterium]|nr:hypothetical protein [Saprospiraceae bacterium]HPN70704.1 hypothetical protein [Saprospiraceae bacterium]